MSMIDSPVRFQIIESNKKLFLIETRPDLYSLATDAMEQEWKQEVLCALPVFLLIQRVLLQIYQRESQYSNIGNSSIAALPWYPNLFTVSFSQPFPIPMTQRLLKNPKGKDQSMLITKSLALVARKVTGKPWLNGAFQNELPVLSLTKRNKVCQRIPMNLGINEVACVTENKLIHFDALSPMFSIFLHVFIKRGMNTIL